MCKGTGLSLAKMPKRRQRHRPPFAGAVIADIARYQRSRVGLGNILRRHVPEGWPYDLLVNRMACQAVVGSEQAFALAGPSTAVSATATGLSAMFIAPSRCYVRRHRF